MQRQHDRIASDRALTLILDNGDRVPGTVGDVSLNGLFVEVGNTEVRLPFEGSGGRFRMEGETWPPSATSAPPIKFKVVRVVGDDEGHCGLGLELTGNQGYFAVAMAQEEFSDFFSEGDDF